jgi:hypothetical protein
MLGHCEIVGKTFLLQSCCQRERVRERERENKNERMREREMYTLYYLC